MDSLTKSNMLTSFLLGHKAQAMKASLTGADAEVRKTLGLPDNIRVTGFHLDATDDPNPAAGCTIKIIHNPDGSTTVICV
jgi:hypothetical protein